MESPQQCSLSALTTELCAEPAVPLRAVVAGICVTPAMLRLLLAAGEQQRDDPCHAWDMDVTRALATLAFLSPGVERDVPHQEITAV